MRVGATEFVEKPFTREQALRGGVARAGALGQRARDRPRDAWPAVARYGMVGRAEAMRRIYQLIEMAAPTKCRVLITGERGTGKELVARSIHALSPRRDRRLHPAELCRHSRRPHRERDVRPREGILHGRPRRPQGQVRGGPRRHPVPRRDRRHEPHHPGEAPARPAGRGDHSRRQLRLAPGRRADPGGHQPLPARRDSERGPSGTTSTTGSTC